MNIPNLDIPEMYGPRVYLRTNSQGFRNSIDFTSTVPQGKVRIICSGDSFTLGYGVSNDHTWCHLLTKLDPLLETVNMGQGGYGVDQMYLSYKRQAVEMEHHIQILAFITESFLRMQNDTFLGYGKPVLDIEHDRMVLKNVPVPSAPYVRPWLILQGENLKSLGTTKFLRGILRKVGLMPRSLPGIPIKQKNEKTRKVLHKILKDLKHFHKSRSSLIILVYLPTRNDLDDRTSQKWVEFIVEESNALDIPFINVISAFRSLPYEQAVAMFIPYGQIAYSEAAGHFNNRGNEFSASIIYENLKPYLEAGQVPNDQRGRK